VQSAVEAVSKAVTRNYLKRCVTEAINGGDPLIYDTGHARHLPAALTDQRTLVRTAARVDPAGTR